MILAQILIMVSKEVHKDLCHVGARKGAPIWLILGGWGSQLSLNFKVETMGP